MREATARNVWDGRQQAAARGSNTRVRAAVAALAALVALATAIAAGCAQPLPGAGGTGSGGTAGASGAPGAATGLAGGTAGEAPLTPGAYVISGKLPATTAPATAAPDPEVVGYRSEEITFSSGAGADAVTLAATLLLPVHATGKLSAVVLVAGSGPTDRDWNNPLLPGKVDTGRVLAEHLAKAGLATLRYDKRGSGGSTKVTVAKWGEFDADLIAARAYLAARPEVDAARIGVLGHSEGAMLAAKAAAATPPGTFAALAYMAGPGRSFGVILSQQVHDSLARDGTAEPAIAASLAYLEDALAKIVAGTTPGPPGGAVAPFVGELVTQLTAPANIDFVRGWLNHDPVATLVAVKCPLLLGVGDNDAQIDPSDLKALRKGLEAAGRKDAIVRVFLHTDHVLKVQPKMPKEMTTKDIALSYGEPRLVSLEVVDALVEFFGRTLAPPK
jgi:dienelactone hydrolase